MGYLGAEKAAWPVLQSEGGVIGQQVRPLLCLVPALESASPTGSRASQHPEPAAPPPPLCLSVHLLSLCPVLPQPQLCGPLAFCSPGRSLADEALQTRSQSRADGSGSKEPGPALRVDAVIGSFTDPSSPPWRPLLTFGSGEWVPGLHADLTASVCPGQGLPTPAWTAGAGSMAQSHSQAVWPLSSVACGPGLHGPTAECRRAL